MLANSLVVILMGQFDKVIGLKSLAFIGASCFAIQVIKIVHTLKVDFAIIRIINETIKDLNSDITTCFHKMGNESIRPMGFI